MSRAAVRSSPSRVALLRHDLGGEWFLDPVVLIAIMPPTILASVTDLAEPTLPSIIGWTVANVIGFMPCFAIAFGLGGATRRRRQVAPLPIVVTFLAGALLGALKVLGTAGAGSVLGLTGMGQGPIAGRVVLSAAFGMVAVPALILIRVVAETFGSRPIAEEGAAARQEAAEVLDELRDALAQAEPSRASGLLIETVEHRLRPLTHRLWSGARMPSSDLTVIGLIRAMLRRPSYPVTVPALAHGVVVTLFALNRVAPDRAIATGLVLAGALAAVLILARTSRPRIASPAAGVAHLALMLLAVAGSMMLVRPMLAPGFVLGTAAVVVFMLVWAVPLVLISGIVATAAHDRDAVRAQLVVMLGPDWYGQLMRSHVDAAAARDIADRLHGDLQGELLAAAARIDRLGLDDARIGAELVRVGALLDGAMRSRADVQRLPLGERLADLQARWAGLLDVEITLHVTGPIGAWTEDLVVGIVSEALTNARRHGMARQVHVRIGERPEAGAGLRVQVDDDGVGPREGGAGIGSAHLDAVAPGAWSRVRRDSGGTRLEVVLAGAGRAAVAAARPDASS